MVEVEVRELLEEVIHCVLQKSLAGFLVSLVPLRDLLCEPFALIRSSPGFHETTSTWNGQQERGEDT